MHEPILTLERVSPAGWQPRMMLAAWLCCLCPVFPAGAFAGPAPAPVAGQTQGAGLRIVAAENFYGDVARQIAGPRARVMSVLNNPDADPHLFETDAATARAVSAAQLVIYNGAGYDSWMLRLIQGSDLPASRLIEVAALLPRRSTDGNPHLWYDPATMPVLARVLCARLQQIDPTHSAAYAARLARLLASLGVLDAQIGELRRRYAGVAVTATEPVANDLTAALGLVMRNRRFQLSIMNDTEPGARETAAFERSLRSRSVRLLLYNRQASSNAVQRLLAIARSAGVPIVGVTETEPPGLTYQQWMHEQLDAIGRALAETHP
jgi:zinc/manganese transport system substrate-binding protein